MSTARTFDNAAKLKYVRRILAGERYVDIARELGLDSTTVRRWLDAYKAKRLKPPATTKPMKAPGAVYQRYTPEFIAKILARWDSGKTNSTELCERYKIPRSMLQKWRAQQRSQAQAAPELTPALPAPVTTPPARLDSGRIDPAIRAAAEADLRAGMRISDAARKHGVGPPAVAYWAKVLRDKDPTALVPVNGNGNAHPQTLNIAASAVASRDATIFLRKAKSELLAGIRAGTITDFDNVHLMSMLALNSLTGGK